MDIIDNNKIIMLIRKLVEITVVILFTVLVFATAAQVITRYVFNNPSSWTEEMARYAQTWMILLMSSICIRKEKHLNLDFLTYSLSIKYQKILKIIIHLFFVMFFLYIYTDYGMKFVMRTYTQVSPAMRIPMYLVYISIPISGLLMIFENVILLFKLNKVKG